MGAVLDELIGEVVDGIRAIDPDEALPRFAGELARARPDLFAGRDEVTRCTAAAQLGLIRGLPALVEAVRTASAQPATHPAVRCALVGALAYLVQPRDLVPDDAPAGYGFVDDCLLLRGAVSDYFDLLPAPPASIERERLQLRLLALAVPRDRLEDLQQALGGIWRLFQRLLILPPGEMEATRQAMESDPLALALPGATPDPVTPPAAPGPDIRVAGGHVDIRLEDDTLLVRFQDGIVLAIESNSQSAHRGMLLCRSRTV